MQASSGKGEQVVLRTVILGPHEVFTSQMLARTGGISAEIAEASARIVADVRRRGDTALAEYTARFDGVDLADMRVSKKEIDDAYQQVDPSVVSALRYAAKRIEAFHAQHLPTSWTITDDDGVVLGQKVTPIRRVGIYVPGGTAQYPSSVLMNAIPARVAGVAEIAMVAPPARDGSIAPATLVAADIAGVTEIYKAGGAQAIGALAYGTETIPPVDKITGPGNAYVASAKKCVVGDVGIDMIAGPSEVLIIADESADATLIAIDLAAQAEHDTRAATYLVTTDATLPARVETALEGLLAQSPRADITVKALTDNSLCVVCDSMDAVIAVADLIAPEHLEIVAHDAEVIADAIGNAGAIFIGPWTPESAGDYVAGPNHTLPTGGTARFSSPLSTEDFLKKSSILHYTPQGLARDRASIEAIAQDEGLWAHRQAVRMRFPLEEGVTPQSSGSKGNEASP